MFYFGRLGFPLPQIYIALAIISFVFIYFQVSTLRKLEDEKTKNAYSLSLISSITPLFSLLLALWCFTFFQSHPTAQLAVGNSSWGTWGNSWIFLLIFHLISYILIIISFVKEHSFRAHKTHFYFRLFNFAFILYSNYCVFGNFPSA